MKITFSPAKSSGTFDFYLCPNWPDESSACATTYRWTTRYQTNIVGSGADSLYTGCDTPPTIGCGPCDEIQETGTNGSYHHVCVFRGSTGGTATSITVTFSPSLPCTPLNPVPSTWTAAPGNGAAPYSSYTWLAPVSGGGISACHSFCFDIPLNCGKTGQHIYHIEGNFYPSPSPCRQEPAVFKTVSHIESEPGKNVNGESNYPNPLESSSGFKTTIPYVTSGQGTAFLTVRDEAGSLVYSDNMDVLGSGQHLWYLSGRSLPAGKYFYQIEFPKGIVITSRTMLIVK